MAASALLSLITVVSQGRAADTDEVRAKLEIARKGFDSEFTKFRKSVRDLLDKREADARKAGDKKLVDQIKEDRAEFERSGKLRNGYPATISSQLKTARGNLDRAYTAAIKDFVRLKEDAAAEAAEREQQAFRTAGASTVGKTFPLTSLKAVEVKAWKDSFEPDTSKYKKAGEAAPHSIFMHPGTKTTASASYILEGKAKLFRGSVGVPKHDKIAGPPASPLTFEVVGDDRLLWRSEPVVKLDAIQTFLVNVEKVKTLTLRVHCPGDQARAHAVWFEPTITE